MGLRCGNDVPAELVRDPSLSLDRSAPRVVSRGRGLGLQELSPSPPIYRTCWWPSSTRTCCRGRRCWSPCCRSSSWSSRVRTSTWRSANGASSGGCSAGKLPRPTRSPLGSLLEGKAFLRGCGLGLPPCMDVARFTTTVCGRGFAPDLVTPGGLQKADREGRPKTGWSSHPTSIPGGLGRIRLRCRDVSSPPSSGPVYGVRKTAGLARTPERRRRSGDGPCKAFGLATLHDHNSGPLHPKASRNRGSQPMSAVAPRIGSSPPFRFGQSSEAQERGFRLGPLR